MSDQRTLKEFIKEFLKGDESELLQFSGNRDLYNELLKNKNGLKTYFDIDITEYLKIVTKKYQEKIAKDDFHLYSKKVINENSKWPGNHWLTISKFYKAENGSMPYLHEIGINKLGEIEIY